MVSLMEIGDSDVFPWTPVMNEVGVGNDPMVPNLLDVHFVMSQLKS